MEKKINANHKNVPFYYKKVSVVDRRLVGGNLKGKKILDIGCGYYLYSDIYFLKKGAKVIGIDFDKENINKANKVSEKIAGDFRRNIDFKFEYGDGRDLKYKDNSFDIVTCFSTLEPMPFAFQKYDTNEEDRIKIIKEMKRVVKPGGIVVLTVPNFFNPFVTLVDFLKHGKKMKYRYSPSKLKKQMEDQGLVITKFDGASLSYVDDDFIRIKLGEKALKYRLLIKILFKPFLLFFKLIDNLPFLTLFRMRIGYRATKK